MTIQGEIRYPWETPPETGDAQEVAPGILWIRMPLPWALNHVNIYALEDGEGWTIVDTGISSKRSKTIWQTILDGPLQGKPVHRVVVTHHHPDHVGLAGWFQTEFGAELWTSRTAWLFSRMLLLDEQALPPEETLAFYRSAGMNTEEYETRKANRPYNYADIVAPMPLGYQRMKEGDVIRAGGRNWTVRMGNGHAPEQVTLWSEDDNLVISGDQILSSISSNIGVYATEPNADPLSEWIEACERFQPHARPDQLVLCGHKLPFTGLPKRLDQLIENHHGALVRLREFLKTPRVAEDCFPPLFKRRIGGGEYGLALVEAIAHLNHLYHLGEVTRSRRADGAWLWQIKDGAGETSERRD